MIPPRPLLRVDATDGRVRLLTATGLPWMLACDAGVVLADGSRHMIGGHARAETGVDGLVVRRPGSSEVPELRWHFQARPEDQALMSWIEVYNATGAALSIARLIVLTGTLNLAFEPQEPASSPWLVEASAPADPLPHTLLAGLTGGGHQRGQVTLEPDSRGTAFTARVHPAGARLAPGGTLGSELLLLVVDETAERATALFAAEVERERRIWSPG